MSRGVNSPDEASADGTWHQTVRPTPTEAADASAPRSDLAETVPAELRTPSVETQPGAASDKLTPITPFAGDSAEARKASGEWDRLPPPEMVPGAVVFDKYRLIELIGEGGMGQVWLVQNQELDRRAALKLIKPEIAKNDTAWRRFKREAQVMAKLVHPNAVAVYDYRRAQSVAYIEMEFVRGKSLDKIMAEQNGQPMPLDWTVKLVDQLCSVLQEAHSYVDEETHRHRPIIHRDLKPSNLMLVDRKPDGENLKVLDFGIAKMASDDDSATLLTGRAEYLGTAAYSSPEQIEGADVDGRSDLYSVGVLLYQLLTGSLPFTGGVRRSLTAHLTQAPRPLREANPTANIPPAVEAVVLQCLEKSPDRRPNTARELAEGFRTAVTGGSAPGKRPPKPPREVALSVQTERAPGRWIFSLKLVIPFFAVLACLGLGMWSLRNNLENRGRTGDESPRSIPDAPRTTDASPPRPEGEVNGEAATPKLGLSSWTLPAGFTAVAAREPVDPALPPPALTDADGRVFERLGTGAVYLPRGFKPESDKGLQGDWPRVIVCDATQARFIRITGGSFEQGDFHARGRAAESDEELNPLTPHWLKLRSFYIQDTEVTNGEFATFAQAQGSTLDREAIRDWQQSFEQLIQKVGPDEARKYPAVAIDWETAARYARAMGGALATEAQWEFVARSRGQERNYALTEKAKNDVRNGAVLFGTSGDTDAFPPMAQSRTLKDKTDHGVWDMTGNVSEWCRDAYEKYDALLGASRDQDHPLVDPVHTSDSPGAKHVVRGGSYLTDPDRARTYQRRALTGTERLPEVGLRIVIDTPDLEPPS